MTCYPDTAPFSDADRQTGEESTLSKSLDHEAVPPAPPEDSSYTYPGLYAAYSPVLSTTQKVRHFCNICGKDFLQPQGVTRHHKDLHSKRKPCSFPGCKSTWTRPYLYRAHIKMHHSEGNPSTIVGKSARSRRIERSRVLPPVDGQSQAEPEQRRLKSPLPAVTKVTHVPLAAMLSMTHDGSPKYAESAIMTRKQVAGRLDPRFAFNASSVFPSTDEIARSGNDIAIQGGQFQMIVASPLASPLYYCQLPDHTGNGGSPPPPAPPSIGYYSNPVFVDRVAELSRSIHSYTFSSAGGGDLNSHSNTLGVDFHADIDSYRASV